MILEEKELTTGVFSTLHIGNHTVTLKYENRLASTFVNLPIKIEVDYAPCEASKLFLEVTSASKFDSLEVKVGEVE